MAALQETETDPSIQPTPVAVREQLTNLRALLVLSILMTESADEDQILRLAASCAPSLGRWRVEGFAFTDGSWRSGAHGATGQIPPWLADEVAGLGAAGGAIAGRDDDWGWAYPLRSVGGLFGYLIARAEQAPSAEGQFLIQVVAQQTGVAVSNARLHQIQRASAEALTESNAALEETVTTLRRGMQIHQRLTGVAAAGEGSAGIAEALHGLTGLPVAIEDRYGNLRAWAGPDRPEPYPKPHEDRRQELLRRLQLEERSVRDGTRVVALASPRPDVLGVIALVDPEDRADTADIMALEHGATVLAVELARLRGLADAELRLRKDLLHDLLNGTDDEGAFSRAEALGYDLGQPHRVVLVSPGKLPKGTGFDDASRAHGELVSGGEVSDPHQDRLLHAVRRALRGLRCTALLGSESGSVVILTPGDPDWEELRQAILREQGGGRARLGVGEAYARPSDLPRSWREAQLALRLRGGPGNADQATVYSDLGVFRMFASLPDLEDVEEFAVRWLRPLVSYDATKGTELVATLTTYLDHGGRYETTAEALSIHRSTLKYRLQRIRELSGYDLNDPETHFNLQLATRAWTTVGVIQQNPGQSAQHRPVRPMGTR
ncbi:MAG: helix-turn-helix domain-containing protein [Actinomycetota bacterium]|nr:helix-turn-helix domain-containing protein [Actinomycetota bacterium]